MQKIVISMGGSVIISRDIDTSFLKSFSRLIKKLSEKYIIYLVVGGGRIARFYIEKGRELNLDEKALDSLGIEITRINASLLTNVIGVSNKIIPLTTDEAKKISKRIVIMGGTVPGHSTDLVGAELAEKIEANKFIIATNVDGIYDKDPNRYHDAKKLKEITIEQLINKYGTEWNTAGSNVVIDGPSLEIIRRAKLNTFVLNGKRLNQIERAINNESFDGTIIKI